MNEFLKSFLSDLQTSFKLEILKLITQLVCGVTGAYLSYLIIKLPTISTLFTTQGQQIIPSAVGVLIFTLMQAKDFYHSEKNTSC